jgi:hypothetical protein
MKLKKFMIRGVSFSLAFLLGVVVSWPATFMPAFVFSPLDGGPLDYNPRLVAAAESPDKILHVKVFRRRNPSYSRYVGAEVFAKVYDERGRLVYEKLIGSDGAWSELIRISQLWGRSHVINKSELKR